MTKQLKAGTETGSLINHIYSGMNSAAPEVGMGCTILSWTDRNAATIVRVIDTKTIEIQEDSAKRVDRNGMSDCQTYEFTPNPDASIQTVKLSKAGAWKTQGGQTVMIGRREKHYDFSF